MAKRIAGFEIEHDPADEEYPVSVEGAWLSPREVDIAVALLRGHATFGDLLTIQRSDTAHINGAQVSLADARALAVALEAPVEKTVIEAAIEEGFVVSFDYVSMTGSESSRLVRPESEHGGHLTGYDIKAGGIRQFRMAGVSNAVKA